MKRWLSGTRVPPAGPDTTPADRATSADPRRHGVTLTVIRPRTAVRGSLSGDGDVRLEGRVEGDLSCGRLTALAGSAVTGAVTAGVIDLGGRIDGPVRADEILIAPGGHVTGDITAVTVDVGVAAEPGRDEAAAPSRVSGSIEATTVRVAAAGLVAGSVSMAESVTIDGTVEGDVRQAGAVCVGPAARVAGSVYARAVTVGGHIDGNVAALTVTVAATGLVGGSVSHHALTSESGARMLGAKPWRPPGYLETLRTGDTATAHRPPALPPVRPSHAADGPSPQSADASAPRSNSR